MASPLRMFEHMVRTANPIQDPSAGLQLPDQVRALHVRIIHTRVKSSSRSKAQLCAKSGEALGEGVLGEDARAAGLRHPLGERGVV